jgi:hypothetical protein
MKTLKINVEILLTLVVFEYNFKYLNPMSMQKIFTLSRISLLKRTLLEFYGWFAEAFESPEKRQYRVLKKFISE